MCFSETASWGAATLMFALSGYYRYKGESEKTWIFLAYFALMEVIQGIGYRQLDMKQSTFWVSLCAFVHITFQPLLANWWFSQWVHTESMSNVKLVYKLCGAFAFFWVLRALFVNDGNRCTDQTHCSNSTFEMKRGCAHIQYLFEMKKSAPLIPSYFAFMFLWFIPVLFMKPTAKGNILKAWFCMAFPLMLTLLLYHLFFKSCKTVRHEAASTWCIIVVLTLVLQHLILETPQTIKIAKKVDI